MQRGKTAKIVNGRNAQQLSMATAAHVHLAYKRIGDQWQKIRAVLPP